MKKVIAILVMIACGSFAFAQVIYQDVVYLKNGSIIRGVVMEQIPNQTIRIETSDKSIFIYKLSEVERLAKEPYTPPTGVSHFEPSFQMNVEMGYGLGVGNHGSDYLKLNIIEGYCFNPYFSLGLGTGLRHFSEELGFLVPLFVDFRGHYNDGKVAPYTALNVGYSFDPDQSFSGVGLMINLTAGISFHVVRKTSLSIGLGYEMQNVARTGIRRGGISINAGISF